MRVVPMENYGIREKGLREQSNSARAENTGVRNEALKIKGVAEQIRSVSDEVNKVSTGPEILQPQWSMIHWEKFLPKRSLKVLLVEYDDSTRHVVGALLRNCSYEVTAVANGLQAWRILEDMTNHIDLVLTEVVMPNLSGVGLLCKIMSHKTLKNIPVIMMSPHDSMGLVFRCLSKGAVDFLVKPIRKNELKNLWQHIWRRCQSSSGSGSGSESGTQSKISATSKCNYEFENNAGSSDERDNRSIDGSVQAGSDNGSGTQSSWTQRAFEVKRSKSSRHQLSDTPDSTCAQVAFSSRRVHLTEKDLQEQDEHLDSVAVGKNLETRGSRNPIVRLDYEHKVSTYPSYKLSEVESLPSETELRGNKSGDVSRKQKDFPVDLNSAIVSCTNPRVENIAAEAPNDLSFVSQINDKATCHGKEWPHLEVTLKRLREVGTVGMPVQDDSIVLRHSDSSAFSKYNTASSTHQAPTGNVGSCSPPDNSGNDKDMAPTIKYDSLTDKSKSNSAFKRTHSVAFQPVQNSRALTPQLVVPGKADDVVVGTDEGSNKQVQVQHHHHHYHHHHHHVHKMQDQSQRDDGDQALKNMETDTFHYRSTSLEGNGGYCSANGSGSGSKHGSNEQNESSKGLDGGMPNMESDNGPLGNDGFIGSGVDESRLTHRKASLTKFHQKRKERCFEKKVRYENRKRMAERRPRVGGKFVRHTGLDS